MSTQENIKGERELLFLVPMYCYLLFLAPHYMVCLQYICVGTSNNALPHHTCGTLSLSATSNPSPSLMTMLLRHSQFKQGTHQASAINSAPTHSAHPPNSLDLPTPQRVVSSSSSYAGTIYSNYVLAEEYRLLQLN